METFFTILVVAPTIMLILFVLCLSFGKGGLKPPGYYDSYYDKPCNRFGHAKQDKPD